MVSVREALRGWAHLPDLWPHLALPALTLGLRHTAIIAGITQASTIEIVGDEFIRTARAKGCLKRGFWASTPSGMPRRSV
jgi:ABC-type dipeptide/oligopeptide/nickel transport system permease component